MGMNRLASYSIVFATAILSFAAPSISLGTEEPPAPPCGSSAQCAATSNGCPIESGWIYLTEKDILCCLPLAADPQEYKVFTMHIKVYNKLADPDARCYRRISATNPGPRCQPVEENGCSYTVLPSNN
jgi:hypothetical protein